MFPCRPTSARSEITQNNNTLIQLRFYSEWKYIDIILQQCLKINYVKIFVLVVTLTTNLLLAKISTMQFASIMLEKRLFAHHY